MSRKIIHTTRRTHYDAEGEPVETIYSSTESAAPDQLQQNATQNWAYETDSPAERATYTYTEPQGAPVPRPVEDWTGLQQRAHTMRAVMLRQLDAVRDLDLRLTRLEDANDRMANQPSFEQNTWWALWGMLMLILGAALIVVILLIFNGLPR